MGLGHALTLERRVAASLHAREWTSFKGTAMNHDHRNGANHAAATRLPEPSRNGDIGGRQPRVETPLPNGDLGADATNAGGPSPSANGANGRDQHGRFTKGNPGGPGNPFARRTAQMRRALTMAVSEEDIAAVAAQMLEQAKAGDVAAAKLLLGYVIGQPAPVVDPDTLDRQEWAVFQQIPVPAPEVARLLSDVPVEFACELARALAPFLRDMAAQKARTVFTAPDQPTKKQKKRGKRRASRALAPANRLNWLLRSS
jgi:hypothetical protein